jgi:D-tyrosyl-tRNA(Tyr) deacylase
VEEVRAVVQRVASGSVTIAGETVGQIGPGLVVLLGVGTGDTESDAAYLAEKIVNLRIFEDDKGKMNLSVQETGGAILAVSQFTLYGDARKGRRPGYSDAAPPSEAESLYHKFVVELRNFGVEVAEGVFQETMLVRIDNDGPVTILLDSKKLF